MDYSEIDEWYGGDWEEAREVEAAEREAAEFGRIEPTRPVSTREAMSHHEWCPLPGEHTGPCEGLVWPDGRTPDEMAAAAAEERIADAAPLCAHCGGPVFPGEGTKATEEILHEVCWAAARQ